MLNFNRKINLVDKKYMMEFYGNEFKLEKLNQLKLRKLYKLESKQIVTSYLFFILNEWIQINYAETLPFVNKLKKYIRKLNLQLTILEKNKLQILDERVFSLDRHIKKLEINLGLEKKESAGAKFTDAKIYSEGNFISEGSLILTNKKAIFNSKSLTLNFYYRNSKININSKGMSLNKSDQKYLIKIHDQITLRNTYLNIKKRKVKV